MLPPYQDPWLTFRFADDRIIPRFHPNKAHRHEESMQTFNLNSLVTESEREHQRWREFLRVPSLSMGLYRLKAGQADEQQPHTEDEVYVVISGTASFRAGEQEQTVVPGSVIFVERFIEHRFIDISEDLTVLVFFAPSEGSLRESQ